QPSADAAPPPRRPEGAPAAHPPRPRDAAVGAAGVARRRTAAHDRVLPRNLGMSPRVLLTGAAGVIGSHVAEALVARGDEVVALDSFDPFYARTVKERNLETLRRGPGFR